jgi:hypothetical protein
VRPSSPALRKAHPSVAAAEMADVIPPQWSQWLRRAREHAPDEAELRADVARRQRLKALAELAEARSKVAAPAVARGAAPAAAAAAALPVTEGAALARAARSAGVGTTTAATAATTTTVAAAVSSPWAAADAFAKKKKSADDGPEAWKPQTKRR